MPEIKTVDQLYDDLIKRSEQPKQSVLLGSYDSQKSTQGKLDFSEITPYKRSTVYDTLSSGAEIARYENFIPGTDNEERLAQQQTTWDKISNGLLKWGGKTLNAVVGGTAGVAYGITEALADGSMSSLYNNNTTNWLSDLDTKLNYQLPNYYTAQEKELGLGGQMLTTNFYADKALGGLSFLTGAIVSEGIWAWATGGTSLASAGARLGARLPKLRWGAEATEDIAKLLQGMSKYKSLLKEVPGKVIDLADASRMVKYANIGGKTGQVANLARFTLTSAGYEASVEALQFRKEAEEKFFNREVPPTPEETAEFYKNLETASNKVFLANMAIVGSSNLVTMGNIFGLKSPIKTGVSEFIDRKVFGLGIDKATKEVIKQKGRQKASKIAYEYFLKPSVTEGLFEEGFQGVTNKVANKWIEHTYDPKKSIDSFDTLGSIYEAMEEQYGSKEGWVENGLGMLIGIVGGSINARAGIKQEQQKLDFQSAVSKTFDQKSLQGELILPQRLKMMNQMNGFNQEAQVEAKKGNIVRSQLAQNDALLSYINARTTLGDSVKDITNEVENTLNAVSPQQWQEAGIENIEDYKKETVSEFNRIAKAYERNKTFWSYIVGRKLVGEQNLDEGVLDTAFGVKATPNQMMIESLTWASVRGENASKYMNDIKDVLGRELGNEASRTTSTLNQLNGATGGLKTNLSKNLKLHEALLKERDTLEKAILTLQNAPKETEGQATQKVKYSELANKLVSVNEKIQNIQNALEKTAEKISQTKQYADKLSEITIEGDLSGQKITAEDLINLKANVEKLQDTIDFISEADPQRGEYLKDLIKEYQDANDIFLMHQASVRMAQQAKLSDINTWVGAKFLKKNKEMDMDSLEWFNEVAQAYQKAKAGIINNQQEETTTTEETETEQEIPPTAPNQVNAKTVEEQIADLEAERATMLSRVSNLQEIIRETVPTTLTESEAETLNNIPNKIERLENEIQSLNKLIEKLGVPSETDPLVDEFAKENNDGNLSYKKTKFLDTIDAIVYETNQPDDWSGKGSSFRSTWNVLKFNQSAPNMSSPAHVRILMTAEQKAEYNPKSNTGYSKALRNLAKENRNRDTVVLIDIRPVKYNAKNIEAEQNALNNQISQLNKDIESLREQAADLQNKKDFGTKEVSKVIEKTNQPEIDKINREYDAKIKALKGDDQKLIDEYKKRIEQLYKGKYDLARYLGDNVEELGKDKPSPQDIERYRELSKQPEETQELIDLRNKLQNWKLLDTAIDDNGMSIAEMIDIVNQQEIETEKEDTKTEVTTQDVEDVLTNASDDKNDNSLLQNQNGSVTAKLMPNGNIRFSHLKLSTIAERLGAKILDRDEKEVTQEEVDNLIASLKEEEEEVFTINGLTFTVDEKGRIAMRYTAFTANQNAMNMYLINPNSTKWTYKNIYEFNGVDMIKIPSDFQEEISAKDILDLKEGDEVQFMISSEDGFNDKKLKGLPEKEQIRKLKIAVIKNGKKVGILKAANKDTEENLMYLRQQAYSEFIKGNKNKVVGKTKIEQVFLGTPAIKMNENGEVVNIPITQEARGVILATGFLEDGKITTNITIPENTLNTSFVKTEPGKKSPFVVFKVGSQMIAYPVTMVRTQDSKLTELENVLGAGTIQEQALAINTLIQDFNIQTEKVFPETLESRLEELKKAFDEHTTFVSAEQFASAEYNTENISNDALINIDLEDEVFTDPKVKISLDKEDVKVLVSADFKNMSKTDIENELSDIAVELDRDYRVNADTKYLYAKGSKVGQIIEDVKYTNTFDDTPPTKPTSQLDKIRNMNILREALSERLPFEIKQIIGEEKLKEIDKMFKTYDNIIKKQLEVDKSQEENGNDKLCPQ